MWQRRAIKKDRRLTNQKSNGSMNFQHRTIELEYCWILLIGPFFIWYISKCVRWKKATTRRKEKNIRTHQWFSGWLIWSETLMLLKINGKNVLLSPLCGVCIYTPTKIEPEPFEITETKFCGWWWHRVLTS